MGSRFTLRAITLVISPAVIGATSMGMLGAVLWLAPANLATVAILAAFVGGWASAWSP